MKNLYVFHGADRKVGVTMTAQCVAEWIAGAAPETDVLLLTMCGRQNVQYQKQPAPPIDRYRSRIESGVGISKKDIPTVKMRYRKHRKGSRDTAKENLYIISGIENEREERLYKPETAEKLIKSVCKQFDIVIVDAGSEIDSGLALGALMMTEKRFLVMTQSEAAITRYEKFKDIHKGIGIVFGNLIINKYDDENPYTAEYLKQRFGFEKSSKKTAGQTIFYDLASVRHADNAEREYKTFVSLKEKRYIRGIEKICKVILSDSDIGCTKNKGKRDGGILFRRLYKNKADKC